MVEHMLGCMPVVYSMQRKSEIRKLVKMKLQMVLMKNKYNNANTDAIFDVNEENHLVSAEVKQLNINLQEEINPFHAAGLFWYLLKTLENRRYQKRSVAWNGLILQLKT